MIVYRVIKKDIYALPKLWKEWWIMSWVDNDYMYFYKEIKETKKRSREEKEAIKTPERKEFFDLYKTIKSNGLSDDKLIHKYNKLVAEWLHDKIILNVKQYKTYLEVKKKKEFALMAQTYLNQARYNDKWEIIEDTSKKFINDIFEERKLNKTQIDNCLTEISNWEYKNKPREITTGITNNIIDYILRNGK